MITDWEKAIEFVLRMEGDLTDDPKDPGGLTKYGISQKAYPNLDIRNLTVDDAKKIYENDYWKACKCDELATPFAISVFDTAVNQGVEKAKRLMQIALDVEVDGIIGDKTIGASFKADKSQIKKFLAKRLAEYMRTIVANPTLLVYAMNWSYRVISLAELIFEETDSTKEKTS